MLNSEETVKHEGWNTSDPLSRGFDSIVPEILSVYFSLLALNWVLRSRKDRWSLSKFHTTNPARESKRI
jgi:hypothetical protein